MTTNPPDVTALIAPATNLEKENNATVRTLHSLLIVYLGPPLMAAALLLFIVSWFGDGQSDARRDAASGVRKGGRIGGHSEMFR
jgi:hypothetical protein